MLFVALLWLRFFSDSFFAKQHTARSTRTQCTLQCILSPIIKICAHKHCISAQFLPLDGTILHISAVRVRACAMHRFGPFHQQFQFILHAM